MAMIRIVNLLLLVCVLGIVGCGGSTPPPELTDELKAKVAAEDKAVEDEERGTPVKMKKK
jgi:hypothetical protein